MEFMIDYNIIGEIFIPYENSKINLFKNVDNNNINNENDNNLYLKYSDFIQLTYKNFRNILFQGEILRFYIILQYKNESNKNFDKNIVKNILENIYFKIEFEFTELNTNKNLNNNNDEDNENEEIEKNIQYDLFTINTENLNDKNLSYENIIYKEFNEDNLTMIYEIYKQILIPKNYLNVHLTMKTNLMIKNKTSFINDLDTLDYYQNGYYKSDEKFKLLKCLYKDVRIINPLKIASIKQIDLNSDILLIQIKIENITINIDFFDTSLSNSLFISKKSLMNNNLNGIDININDILILKEETNLIEENTINLNLIKNILFKNDKINLTNINFSLYNTEIPVIIHPGEQYYLTFKVKKISYLNEKNNNIDINNNNNIEKIKEEEESNNSNFDNESNDKLLTISNIKRKLFNGFSSKSKSKEYNPSLTVTGSSIGFTNSNLKNITNSSGITNENLTENENDNDNGENFLINLNTPILFNIKSNLLYNDLFMCLPLNWNNEIKRFLKIEINTPNNITNHKYFEINLKIQNISSNIMNLDLKIVDNNNKYITNDNENDNMDYINSNIISEIKYKNIGILKCNENKIFNLKFLPLNKGYAILPNLKFIDKISGKIFLIIYYNKIYIN